MSSFKSRGVTFTVDKEGRVSKIVGYSALHQKIEVNLPKGGLRLHARSFEDAAFSLGFRNPDELQRHLSKQGIMVSGPRPEPPKLIQWLTSLAT